MNLKYYLIAGIGISGLYYISPKKNTMKDRKWEPFYVLDNNINKEFYNGLNYMTKLSYVVLNGYLHLVSEYLTNIH